jgi:GNAT superfamily N-acetyltransferase
MILPDDLINQGFSLQEASTNDLGIYIDINKACCKKYVDQYYGGWNDEIQTIINTDSFNRMVHVICFYKILQGDRPVGFFSYAEQENQVGEVSIYILPQARKKGLEASFIGHITSYSTETGKPVFITVFRSSPLKDMFESFGFEIYDKSRTHFLMSYNQKDLKDRNNYMNRIYYEPKEDAN